MIGVLALQGAFQKHLDCLHKIQAKACLVKHPHELKFCSGLILPGGESTAHLKLLHPSFERALSEFGKRKPIFGTCCGLILLAKEVVGKFQPTLGLLNITAKRNAYGRQIESFESDIQAQVEGQPMLIQGCFIRAPQIVSVGSGVEVLAKYNNKPVLVQNHLHLAAVFHPEISMDVQLHEYFYKRCLKNYTEYLATPHK